MFFPWSVSSYVNWCFLTSFSFLNLRRLTLLVVQFSFAIFYPAMFRTLRLFLRYHTFIFQQTKLTLCFYDAFSFIHLPLIRWKSCLLAASPWVYSSVMLVLLLFSVSCFVLTYKGSKNWFYSACLHHIRIVLSTNLLFECLRMLYFPLMKTWSS